LDLLVLNVVFLISIFLKWGNINLLSKNLIQLELFVINLLWLLVVLWLHAEKKLRMESVAVYVSRMLNAFFLHVGLICIFVFKFNGLSIIQLLVFYALFLFVLVPQRIFVVKFIKHLRKRGYNFRTIAFCGWNSYVDQFHQVVKNDPSIGYSIKGYFDADKNNNVNEAFLGNLNAVVDFIENNKKIDELFITSNCFNETELKKVIHSCNLKMTRIRVIPNLFPMGLYKRFEVVEYGDLPAYTFRKEPLEQQINRTLKRIFDIIFSLVIIFFILSWLFPLIALIIKFTSKGPVFFKQLRSGENSEKFYCYKFRTMKVNEQCDEIQATKDDPRITKIGAFLRKTNLDELPQFFNVFLGSMSVIGPRPHMIKHTESYSEKIDDFMVRHFIKPGITGWAQVNGYRGETKEVKDMENRVKYDIWYIENWNFLLDFKILFLTIYRMSFGDPNAF
jgi:undecaprenyl-phosphate galactose phosphotransferase/putative colanic acid biosynthesis UDP-glucose lipid carrier transferase